jgi:hypothetical protein
MVRAALHEDLQRKQEGHGSSDRAFGLVFCAFFALVGLLPLRAHHAVRLWALALSAVFLIIGLVHPVWLAPLNWIWTKLGILLGRIVNPVVTAVLFYVVVTPTAVLFRLLGKDPLHIRADPEVDSYWIERNPPGPPLNTMSNQY